MEHPDGPILLFDGVCNLCNGVVRWIIRRDRRRRFRFASLQSEAGRSVLARVGALGELPDSMILIDSGGIHSKSEAAIRIARYLGFPWSAGSVAAVLPRRLRDAVYDWVARNRYRWFGRRERCLLPTSELRTRFLDADSSD